MKKIYKFVMIVLLFIMLFFSEMSIYLAENSDIDSIKAEGSSTKVAKKNLLDPSKWQVSYSYRGIDMNGSSTSTDPLNNKFNLSTYLTKSPVDINSWGTGQVTSTNGLYFYVDVPDERDKNTFSMDKRIGTRQKVSLKSGRYYQYKFRVFLSHGDKLYPYSTQVGFFNRWYYYSSNAWITIKKNMRATSSSDTLYLSGQAVLREGITKPPAKTTYEDIQLVDITDKVLGLVSRVKDLFKDETQTELKLSTTQKKINEVKADFNEYSDILGASDKETVNNGLIKAQQLLDEIDTSVSIVDLEDSISKDASHTIRGTTYPNAFLYFSSDADIILDGELSSEVEGDPKKYQMRADKEGHFNYTLEEGKYFKAKEIVTIIGMLNGKETLQKFVVKDTTPPEQSTFNSLKDKTNYFSGTAEASAMIKVYDTSDNSLVLYGNTDVDGTYSLTIPELKKPLIPYQNYYVTATDIAGNVSLQSKKQQVADTTAPTADPVKQVLTLGDSLPEISTFISHLYDNAGAENVRVSFKKKPDIYKVEYTTAEILLTDKSGNNQVVNVPVIIKDTETQLDENNMLTASEFTIPAIYYPETESEKRQFLIEKSQLLAWDIGNGKDVKAQVILDKQLLERKPGMYQIVFMVGNLKKEISVTLTSGTLAFKKFQRKFHLEQPKFNRRSS